MSPARRAMLLMIAFAGAWAAVEALAGLLAGGYSPYQVVFTRYAVHLALLLAAWGWRAPVSLLRTRRPVTQLARSLLMLGMPACFILAAERGVAPAATLAIFWCAPLLVLALAWPVLGELAPRRTWLLTALACAAAAAVYRPGALPGAARALLPAGMAACFALYVAMTRALRGEPTRVNLFYTALGVALALSPAMPRLWIAPSPRDLAIMIAIGALGLGALWALDRMAASAPLSASAPLAVLQVPFAVGLHAVAQARLPGAGTALAVAAIAAVSLYAWNLAPAPVRP